MVIALVVLVVATAGLAAWWWSLRSAVDPIAADPVAASAVVTSSAPCSDGGATTVHILGTDTPSSTRLDGCGFAVGQRIAVEYLAGHPDRARLAGTSTAGRSTVASRVVPIAVLAAGLAAVVLIGLLVIRRRSTGDAPPADAPAAVTVAELRARIVRPSR